MPKIACMGECMLELRHKTETDLTLAWGGDTLNTALYLARLLRRREGHVAYVTALGDDPYSDTMLAGWAAEGIDTALVTRLPGRLPGLYAIRTDSAGERRFFYWRSAAAAREMLRDDRADQIRQSLADYGLIYLSGITLSILETDQREILNGMLGHLRDRGAGIVFDSNYRARSWPSPEVARQAFGSVLALSRYALVTFEDEADLHGDADPTVTADRLHRSGVEEVVVKQGARGCLVSAGGRRSHVPAERVEKVVDTTAAGDSFNAGYLAARLLGEEPEAAAAFANRVAARVVRHQGAVIPQEAMEDLVL